MVKRRCPICGKRIMKKGQTVHPQCEAIERSAKQMENEGLLKIETDETGETYWQLTPKGIEAAHDQELKIQTIVNEAKERMAEGNADLAAIVTELLEREFPDAEIAMRMLPLVISALKDAGFKAE